jgi:hypothetical protein
MSDTECGQNSLVLALERASSELTYISERVARLEHAIPDAIRDMPPGLCQELQTLDYITQHLEELRTFIDAVAALSDDTWAIDIDRATTTIRLAHMIERLRGVARQNQSEDAGDMELLYAHVD